MHESLVTRLLLEKCVIQGRWCPLVADIMPLNRLVLLIVLVAVSLVLAVHKIALFYLTPMSSAIWVDSRSIVPCGEASHLS